MANDVESMMYVGKTPWHGLGVPVPEGSKLSIEEAIVAAGLNWDVELRHLFTEGQKNEHLCIIGSYVTCRTSDNKVLGIVGRDYEPLQNIDAFKWFQPFLESGEATIETAGSLKGGSRIWVLAKIKRDPMSVGQRRHPGALYPSFQLP